MKIELTDTELAKLKANSESINNIEKRILELRRQLDEYSKSQKKLEAQIRERIDESPKTPLEKWDFSGVDWINYEGKVIIPEDKENGN